MAIDSNPNNNSESGFNKPPIRFTPQIWLIFLCLIAALIGFTTWSKLKPTQIDTAPNPPAASASAGIDQDASAATIDGKGVFMPPSGKIYSLNTRVDGSLKKLYIQPGDYVKQGQLVAEVSDYEYNQKLAKAKSNVENTTKELDKLREQIRKEGEAELNVLKTQLAASEFNVTQIDRRIKSINRDIGIKKKLLEKGLIAPARISETEDTLSSAEVERESAKSTIASLRFELLKGYRTEDLKSKEDELNHAIQERDLLVYHEHYYKILSPWDALVLELESSEGDILSRGQVIALMETEKTKGLPDQVLAFFPIEQGKRIQVGNNALITVSTIDSQQYGKIVGKVIQVSKYPVSIDSVSKLLHNSTLVDYLTGSKSTIQVTIKPELNAGGKGFKWTKDKQPPTSITTGTVDSVTITF